MYKDLSLKKLSLPIFIQMILSMSAGTIDTAMISSCGDDAVGAIGVSNQVIMFLTLAYQIIASSSGIVVAQYLGAGRGRDAIMDRIYTVAVFFNLCLSVAICFIVVTAAPLLLRLINTPPVMIARSVSYMRIVGCFLFCQSVGSVLISVFNVHGKTYIGMIVFLSMDILNIAGNWTFLFGPLKHLELGVAGVAISTSFSSIVATLAIFIAFRKIIRGRINIKLLLNKKRASVKNQQSNITQDTEICTAPPANSDLATQESPLTILKKLLKLGIPSAGESISYSIAQIIITAIVNTIGAAATTTRVYCNMLINFNMIYANSMAEGTAIITGQAVGAQDYDYAYKRVIKSARLALAVSVSIAVINFLLSRWTLGIFTRDNNIIALGMRVMTIGCFLEIGRSLNLVVIRSMRAAGDVFFPVVMGILSMWIVSAAGSYLLGVKLGLSLPGVWCAMAADEILRAIIACIRWILGYWRGKSVVGNTR